MPILRPFFTYFGGKFRGQRYYPHPIHKIIIEPFAGSAGYSLHHPSRRVLLYDLDPRICGVWNYLIKVTPEEVHKLPTRFDDVRDLHIPQEARDLIGFWLNIAQAAPACKPSLWVRQKRALGDDRCYLWNISVRSRIAYQVNYIRHWRVFNKSYRNMGNVEATWFIDPPYSVAGTKYKFGPSLLDYDHLSEWCKNRKGQVIVCENVGADWLPFQHLRTMQSSNYKDGKRVTHEAIWTNQPDLIPERV